MGIFGYIFGGQDLDKKKAEFDEIKNEYLKEGRDISSDAIKLFECRKESIRTIQRVKSYIDRLDNCPKYIERGIAKALAFTDNFRETMQWEVEAVQSSNISSVSVNGSTGTNIGIKGVSAGSAIATMGPTAALAIATTFGTASTGVAISSLGGITATNAALAWLGSGAIAVGGAGMVGGSALFALAGPFVWVGAGVAALGTSYKNRKAIDEIDRLIEDINFKLMIIYPKHQKLKRLISATKELNGMVNLDIFLSCPNDFTSERFPKDELFNIVNICKTMGKMVKDTIAMEMQ